MREAGGPWQRVIRHALVLLGGGAVSALLALATLSITAHTLSPAAFGVLVIAQTYALLVERLGTFQSWQTLICFGSIARARQDDGELPGLIRFGRRLDLGGAIVGSTIGIAVAALAGHLFGWEHQTRMLAVAYGGSVLLRMNGTSLAVLRMFDRFDQTAIARAVAGVVRLVATVVAMTAGASLPVFAMIWIASDIMPSALMAIFSARAMRAQQFPDVSPLSLHELRARHPDMLGMFWTTNWHSTIKVVARDTDVLIAGMIGGPAVAGVVRIARQLGGAMGQLADPFTQAIYPELAAAAAAHRPESIRALTLRAARWGAAAGAVVLLMLSFVAPALLDVIAGDKAGSYSEAVPALMLFALAQAIALATLAVSPALLALGRANQGFAALCVATVLYAAIIVPCVRTWGASGAAIALVIYQVTWAAIAWHCVFRQESPRGRDADGSEPGTAAAATSLTI